MTALLEMKERLKQLYGKYSLYIMVGIRFITALVVFTLINQNVGFMIKLKNPAISLMLALFCAFLPQNVIIFCAAALILLHLYAASLEFALMVMALFLILLLLYYRFAPKHSFVLLLTPVAFVLKVPYLIPLVMGLIATPVAAVPVSFGIIVYYLLYYVKQSAVTLTGTEIDSTVHKYVYVMEHALKRPEIYLMIVAFTVTIIAVYLIRRLSVDYAWTIAIFSGCLIDVFILLTGDFILDVSLGIAGLFLGSVISIIITWLLQFFVFSVDYSRTEYVQFQDDEYYYYVKAVPKMSITQRDKTVKRINPQRKVREERRRNTLK